MRRRALFFFALTPSMLLFSTAVLSQAGGTFQGSITDTSAALLPGAEVTIVNLHTSAQRTVISSSSGFYRATNIPTGVYELRASLSGFKTAVNTRVELTVGIIQRVDFVLQVGNLTEQVVVTAEASLIQTEEGRVSALVTEQQIASLPLNGRNIYQLAQLQMGVIGHINSLGLQGNDTDTFAAQGNRHRGTNYLLDGADNNNSGIGGEVSLVPSQEAVEEFRLSTTNFSPEFGRNAGAVVEVVTKSGTNEFHGSIWEYHRNAALDAREFTDRTDPAQLIQNQFGFSLGGPVEKDRAWFFGYYEGERQAFGKSVSFQTEHPAFVNTVLANPTLNSSNAGELFRRHPSLAAPSATSFTADEFMSAIVREAGPTFGGGFSGNWFADWDADGDVDAVDMDSAHAFWRDSFGVQLVPGQLDRIKQRATAMWNLLQNNPTMPVLGNTVFGPAQRFSSDQIFHPHGR